MPRTSLFPHFSSVLYNNALVVGLHALSAKSENIFHALRAKSQIRLSWTHYRIILQENSKEARDWYEQEAAREMWGTRTLQRNVSSQYYHRLLQSQKKEAVRDEMKQLTAPLQDKLEYLKNPVVAEFLGFKNNTDYTESDLEQSIIDHLIPFLMELGKGFTLADRQKRIHTEKEDYYIDLVFYNYNLHCFVLIGEQGTYKSTFFARLLPPELRQYYMVKTDNTVLGKDDRLQLAKNMLICLEEIDALSVKELNQLKAMITMPVIKDRPAYARNYVNLPRIASLCATGNNESFLNDPTGSRRWLPFLIDHIDDPRTYDIDYEKLYSQAFHLAAIGTYQYWFTQEEIKEQNEHNKRFETECIEEQLIMKYYAQPTSSDTGVYLTSSEILEKINGGIKKPLSTVKIGRIMKKLGYSARKTNGHYKYHVNELQLIDIQQNRRNEITELDSRPF